MAAKNNASEKALRDIIIQRMAQSPRGTALKTVNDPQQQTNTGKPIDSLFPAAPALQSYLTKHIVFRIDDLFHDDVDMVDNGDGDDKADDESEVPMMHLASFALHKLFSEWQAEGFEIPDFKAGALPAAAGAGAPLESMLVDKPAKQAGTPTNRSQVPEDAAAMHPTTLLNNVSDQHHTIHSSATLLKRLFGIFRDCIDASWYQVRGLGQRGPSAQHIASCRRRG